MSRPDVSITLVSHASAVISIGDTRILTDPWQFGTAFNDSWKLIVPPADLEGMLDTIDFLWISHEHPDHFHIPTLKSLPEAFRKRVTVLFQRSSDSDKMVKAFTGMLGFANVRLLDHRTWVPIAPGAEVYCYHSRQIDSALAVRGGGRTILNLNDCEASARDLETLHGDLGPVDVLLNQFSIAGFDGNEAQLASEAATILDTMIRDHRTLEATTTVPFASFVYFCCTDNARINRFANSPRRVADRFAKEGLDVAVLAPGDSFVPGQPHDNGAALAKFDAIYDNLDALPLTAAAAVPLDQIQTAFTSMRAKLVRMHGRLALRLLKPVTVAVPDLGVRLLLSVRDGTLTPTDADPDIEINSQPLHFLLSNNFGLQTLGVSGRYTLHRNLGNWFRHRALFAMLNAGIGMSVRQIVSPRQLAFFWRRRGNIVDQLRYRIGRTMKKSQN